MRQYVAFGLMAAPILAHTWVEQMTVIGDNGTYTGPYGYPRGYMARTDPGFNGESDLWLLPALDTGRAHLNTSDYLCRPTQRTQNQTAGYPRLQVAPGSYVALTYLENGHVTLPQNQPGKPAPSRGTVFIYGTSQPKDDERITDVLQWTPDGSGGDKRGKLLASNNYDDDRCHQINSGQISQQRQSQFPNPIPSQPGTKMELWCEADVQMPTDLNPSSLQNSLLTLYMVWDWPWTNESPIGWKSELYTTCMDVEVVPQLTNTTRGNFLPQQDPNTLAVSTYKSRLAMNTIPSYFTMPGASVKYAVIAEPTAPATPPISATSPAAVGTVLTALVTVVATLAPGQTGTVVSGTHVVTFGPSGAASPPAASVAPSMLPATTSSAVETTVTVAPVLPLSPLGLSAVQPSFETSPPPTIQETPSLTTVTIAPFQSPDTADVAAWVAPSGEVETAAPRKLKRSAKFCLNH